MLLRRILSLLLLVMLGVSSHAATRWVTEREGAPVRWQAWGPAAFERAKKENRPIFLFIGSASSYEHYRMHREVFLNGEIAEYLNAYFVPIVLDRIEYPEVARAYESILPATAVFLLTPSLEPFAGAAFVKPDELNRLLVINANRWTSEKDAVIAEAHANVEKTRALGEKKSSGDTGLEMVEPVIDAIRARLTASRTVDPMVTPFLIRHAARTHNEVLTVFTSEQLLELAASLRRDHLGGGFHRSADALEKMLPDQARLANAYLEASQIVRNPELTYIARTTLDYVLRDLRFPDRSPFEAFQDAHSVVPGQGPVFVNGAFYLWDIGEVTQLVGRDDAGKIARLFDLREAERKRPMLSDAGRLHELHDELATPLAKMLEVRQKRPAPFREATVIAGWNGLTISALARGAVLWNEPKYLDAATAAASYVTTKMWNPATKTLKRTDGGVEALGEDYALLIQGLLDLFDSSYDPKWLELAIALQQRQDALFWDASAARYTIGTSLPPALRGLLVERDDEVPSINGVSVMNLLRLAMLTGNATWRARPELIFQSFAGRLRNSGYELAQLAASYETSLFAPRIFVVTGDMRRQETRDMLAALHAKWEPMRAIVFLPVKGAARERVVRVLPFTGALQPDPERTIAYVCADGKCMPTTIAP